MFDCRVNVTTFQVGFRPLFILVYKMNKSEIAEKIKEIVLPIASANNVELVEVKVLGAANQPNVRIFIDKTSGITHEDCSAVSTKLSEILDEKDFISESYILEVSSLGVERPLYSLKDFERFIGSLAKVKLKASINKQKQLRGKIAGVENETIIFDDKVHGIVKFELDRIAKANLEIDLEAELKRQS
jgi:ribosome maturation factor RimP